MSATYARVYSERSGADAAEIRRLMAEETWFGGADAVDAGLADGVSDEPSASTIPDDMAAAQEMFSQAVQAMQMCIEKFSGANQSPPERATATAGHTQAMMAATQEVPMDPEETSAVATPTQQTQPQAAAAPTTMSVETPDADDVRRQGAIEERARQRAIREMARPFMSSGQLTQEQIDGVIDEGTAAAEAGNRFLAVMAAGEPPVTPAARITRDETDTRMDGLIRAMMRDYDGPGAQFRGIRLRGLAMELAGGGGFSDTARIQRGMRSTTMMGGAHGVSDFAYITTEVMNRSLIAEYDRRGANWNVVTGMPLQASDFREINSVRFGGDFQLKTVKDNGEYEEAVLADESEGLKVDRRGLKVSLTFEAVVNDDMGAFDRIPREFALAARVMESSMVWSLIRTNAVLKSDGVALFAAAHKNLAASGAAISVATVGAARKAMWEQTAFGSKDPDDFLQVSPDTLIFPPAIEVAALQFVTGITPNKTSDANPYRNTLTPVSVPNIGAAAGGSDTAWYLVSSDLPPISVAYMDEYPSPTVQTIEGMNPDKVTMQARHIFGAATSEFRGAYQNPGA